MEVVGVLAVHEVAAGHLDHLVARVEALGRATEGFGRDDVIDPGKGDGGHGDAFAMGARKDGAERSVVAERRLEAARLGEGR